ncbi:MAG: Orotidine 5'-phosphate decarboxylase [candidate division WS2 bacterium]|nr:Orotidine 5'-phosphate decarboxylase [Candidatus Lithacetigena glycinireducens]MBT9174649.1 Orotidine 5'-phosphate decarboxylase [Candidatus Lithacetigena glycinireducens]
MELLIDKLYEAVKNQSPLCLGLDTDFSYIPNFIKTKSVSAAESLFNFNRLLIDSAKQMVGVVKVQIAFYEAQGIEGLKAYSATLKYLTKSGLLSIADIKRGDVSASAMQYALAHFSGDFEADFVTLNPYLGFDSLQPFLEVMEKCNKGAFILVRTSNPSARDIQDLEVSGIPVYQHIGKMVSEWGKDTTGINGYSCLGVVFGATYPLQLKEFRELYPETFLLVPGYGAQGANKDDITYAFNQGNGAVINVSRSIITTLKDCLDEKEFMEKAHLIISETAEEIKTASAKGMGNDSL